MKQLPSTALAKKKTSRKAMGDDKRSNGMAPMSFRKPEANKSVTCHPGVKFRRQRERIGPHQPRSAVFGFQLYKVRVQINYPITRRLWLLPKFISSYSLCKTAELLDLYVSTSLPGRLLFPFGQGCTNFCSATNVYTCLGTAVPDSSRLQDVRTGESPQPNDFPPCYCFFLKKIN